MNLHASPSVFRPDGVQWPRLIAQRGRRAIERIALVPRASGRSQPPGRSPLRPVESRPVRFTILRPWRRTAPGDLRGTCRSSDGTPGLRVVPSASSPSANRDVRAAPGPHASSPRVRPCAGRPPDHHRTLALTGKYRELSTGGRSAVDGTRARRTRDKVRQAWYARHRQRRFARFLGFDDKPRDAASPPTVRAGRASAALARQAYAAGPGP